MRTALLIICLFVLTTSFHSANLSTTWAGNTNNQGLSKTAMLDAVLNVESVANSRAGYTLTSSQELITKAEVLSLIGWETLNTSDPQWVATASNEAVTKTDISVQLYSSLTGDSEPCGGTSGSQTLWYDCATDIIYTSSSMTTPFNGGSLYYHVSFASSGTLNWQINSSGVVINTCAP